MSKSLIKRICRGSKKSSKKLIKCSKKNCYGK